MLVIGFAAGRIQSVPANLILVKNISVIGVVWGAQAARDPVLVSRNLAELLRWWEAGRLKPLVAPDFSAGRGRRGDGGAAVAPLRRQDRPRNVILPSRHRAVSVPGRPGSGPSSARRGRASTGSPTRPSPPCRTAPRPATAAPARPERGRGAAPARRPRSCRPRQAAPRTLAGAGPASSSSGGARYTSAMPATVPSQRRRRIAELGEGAARDHVPDRPARSRIRGC